jgi:predicted transposase/invertase (TIGR01784 family)
MSHDKPLISFDYAIKYLLKDKRDFSIVEGFISALLKTIGYKEVKIVGLLESESQKEDPKSKRSLADVIVEDEDKHQYIIEIERNIKDTFVHKSCFNTSRLIVDTLGQSQDYTQILKVFHISLLYFPIGNNQGTIYHGKTVIHEIESQEKLSIHITDPATQQEYDATHILPEYFYISVPAFNDRLEKEIDDWLYVMKHDEVPHPFHSKYMEQVREKLSILKMSPEERAGYYNYLKKIYSDRDELQAAEARGEAKGEAKGKAEGIEQGLQQGIEQGVQQGIENRNKEIAKNMLKKGFDISAIQEITGLSKENIEKME